MDILGIKKNTHKNPKFGKVRQVPTREFPTKFPDWDSSHSSKFGIFVGILYIPKNIQKWESVIFSCVMDSRQLWNSHQRHKFLRAMATREILKLRVLEMPFPGVFKRQFPPRMPCCFVRIHARLRTMPLKCSRRSMTLHGSNGQI